MQTGRQHVELRSLVIPAAGITFGGASLLEVNARLSGVAASEDIVAYEEGWTPLVLDLEDGLSVLVDSLDACDTGDAHQMEAKMVLGDTASNRSHQSVPAADDVQDFMCR